MIEEMTTGKGAWSEQVDYAAEPIKLKDIPIWGAVVEGALCPVARG